MRKAFIGLSTPIGFDYTNNATKTKADIFSSPNPVLDSPFGLLLLFDELVFLTRSLCPENMRNLSYVSFLDEGSKLPHISSDEIDKILNTTWNKNLTSSDEIPSFQDAMLNAGVKHDMAIDNHTHGLRIKNIGDSEYSANSTPNNLAIDALIYSRINDPSMELITNSFLQPYFETEKTSAHQTLLTQLLVLDNIPNYLTPSGPYHPVIEEVRANKHLLEFRKWVTKQQGLASQSEVKDMKAAVESALQDAQEKLFLKYCDPKRHYKSVGKAILGDAISLVFPAAGTVNSLIEAGTDIINPNAMRWQGFIVGARRATRSHL